jgi:hypothetical protein
MSDSQYIFCEFGPKEFLERRKALLEYRIADGEESLHWMQDSPTVSREQIERLSRRIQAWREEKARIIAETDVAA